MSAYYSSWRATCVAHVSAYCLLNMCSHTAKYLGVLILLCILRPRATIRLAPSYCYVFSALILLYIQRPHTTIYPTSSCYYISSVLILLYIQHPHATIYPTSSYYYISSVLILPHTTPPRPILKNRGLLHLRKSPCSCKHLQKIKKNIPTCALAGRRGSS